MKSSIDPRAVKLPADNDSTSAFASAPNFTAFVPSSFSRKDNLWTALAVKKIFWPRVSSRLQSASSELLIFNLSPKRLPRKKTMALCAADISCEVLKVKERNPSKILVLTSHFPSIDLDQYAHKQPRDVSEPDRLILIKVRLVPPLSNLAACRSCGGSSRDQGLKIASLGSCVISGQGSLP